MFVCGKLNELDVHFSDHFTLQRIEFEQLIYFFNTFNIFTNEMLEKNRIRQVLLFLWILSLGLVRGQVSYSIPEEMPKGSFVGNIAQDLGLDLKRLNTGKARIYTGDDTEYISLNKDRGVLSIKERIDREALCRQTTPCALHFQIMLEDPMEFYTVTVEITDINDNPPVFRKNEMKFEINELAQTGARFVLETANDQDVGVNGLLFLP